MRIDRIELFHVAMPLIYPWRTAYGEDADIHAVLCRMTSGSVEAWSESSPLAAPCYSPEWGGGVFAVTTEWLAPSLIGKNFESGAELQYQLRWFKGNPFAKALLDCGWWALAAKIANQPLHRFLGATRDEVPVGADFGVMDSVGDLLSSVGKAVEEGFPRIKLKFRPGWDIPVVGAVRRQFPKQTFHIDCNSGYCIDDLPLFKALDEFELAMVEQPLAHDDVVEHAQLQKAIRTPVCLDETIVSPRHARVALSLGSCKYVNVKPGRVGGLTNALAIHDLCRSANIPCWVGGMLESATGAAQCVALGMLDNFTYPADIFPSERFYHEDLSDPPLVLHKDAEGRPAIRAFERMPEPVPDRLRRMTVQHAVVE